MAVADIVVLVVVVLSLVAGLWRGLVKEAFSLACWIAAGVLAALFNAEVATYLGDWFANPGLQRIVAFALIFVLTIFAGGIVGTLLSKLTSAVGLQAADRALGGLFGLARGLLIVSLAVMLTAPFELFQPWYAEARSVPYLLKFAGSLREVLEEHDLLPEGTPAAPAFPAGLDDLAGVARLQDNLQGRLMFDNRGKIACVA